MSLPVDKALRKAQSHIKVGELAEAEKLYKQVLAKFPKNKKAIQGYQKLNVGITSRGSSGSQPPQEQINELVSLYNQGQFEEVLSNVKPLVSLFPKAINLFNIQGASYAALQKYDAAVDSYKQAIKFKPNYAGAYYNMGVALQNKGDFEETIYSYKQAIKIKPDYAEAYYNMGIALKDKGELDAAIDSYKQAIKIKPDYAEAYSNMGVALNDQGELDAAIDSCKQAIKIKLDYAEAYYNMGIALKDKGELDVAIDSYKQAIKIKPDYAEAYSNMSVALNDQGELDAAIDSCKQAIKIKPDYAKAYFNMGTALKDKGELDAAIDSYKQAIKIKPDYAEAYSNMGVVRNDQGELDAAIDSCKQAIKIKPGYAEAYYNMGIVLRDKGELDAAIDSYKQAIKIKPDYAEAYSNMGVALNDQGELDAAIDSCKQAIKIKPDYAKTYYNMGTALRDKGELDAAIDSYKQAIKIKPNYAEAYYNSSFALLNSGRLKEGLDEYEWRWKTPQFLSMQRHFSQPLWDGEISLQNKRILVWCEQGLGDTLKWSSRLSVLATQSGHCILECQEKIVPLLSRSFPNVEVKAVDISRDTERDDFDLHLPMGSLYRHFITEITQNSKPDAFLIPDPVRVKFWKDRLSSLGNGPNVGISWKSSDMGAERSKHFSSLSEWSSLFALPNINFINLQYADAADGLLQIQNEFGVKVHNFDDLDQYNDLDEVAALSAALDGVVSFGTSVPMITAGVGTLTKCAALDHHLNFHNSPVGPFLDTYERKVGEPWSNVFGLIANDITKL